jgi:hypothetical protein
MKALKAHFAKAISDFYWYIRKDLEVYYVDHRSRQRAQSNAFLIDGQRLSADDFG